MNVSEVRKRVKQVRESAADFERAHSLEDELHHDVLRSIARGTAVPDAASLATEALRTRRIRFARACA